MVNIKSNQTESETGGRTVHYSWSPPWNMLIEEISHYVVTFNGTFKKVDNPGDYYDIEMEQSVHSCASHNINIIAVDICGRKCQRRNHVVTKVWNATSV